MNKQILIKMASDFIENSRENYITNEIAISQNVVGMKIFEAPIFGVASSEDKYFTSFKEPSIIGKHFMLPKEWLPEARSVISFFLPFSQAVKKGNGRGKAWPSEEWLHGRIEGQAFINKLCIYLKTELIQADYNSLVPALDKRFWAQAALNSDSAHSEVSFTSTWSERHAAFVCGLGTFGLSKGLITSKGVAGRFGSIITELYLSPDKREYQSIYEYCSMCGACIKKCPVNAISIEKGKNHIICSKYLDKTAEKYKPRYGCGKCQIGVPCESRIPKQYDIK
ncbi:4Fe-4S binding protein [Clostridium sp. FP1]|uniref:4Fe-4S binding protein n=1 Tax=Clostridium sp. FP1 TaxID=2724076 RepID=UPI0013E954EF|nr:4Fe-4S binding protein [Clostridium sp. FP1]MBZ9634500.1 4Fe-4S binding protein [Clostridium sp. FP1]